MPARLQEIDPEHPQPRAIDQAVEVLEGGGLVVYPTDTAYGIGCDLLNKQAAQKLYALKARDPKRPVTFLCESLSQAASFARVGDAEYRMLRRLTPGPYTFILRATKEVPKLLITRQKTVGVRIPDSEVALALVRGLGHPILSTTATEEDGAVIADPREIRDRLGHGLDLILDVGLNLFDVSTVVDLTGDGPEVLREGKGRVDAI